jgi:hypothetical protein
MLDFCLAILRARKEALEKARAFMQAGNLQAADQAFQRAVDVTPLMTRDVIQVSALMKGRRGWHCLALNG